MGRSVVWNLSEQTLSSCKVLVAACVPHNARQTLLGNQVWPAAVFLVADEHETKILRWGGRKIQRGSYEEACPFQQESTEAEMLAWLRCKCAFIQFMMGKVLYI